MTSQHSNLARAQMEAELASLSEHLESVPPTDDFVLQLIRRQSEDRVSALRLEMDDLESEIFELSFSEKAAFAKHSISTSVLANLLTRFQKAITYAGWARLAGPGVHGPPPSLISRAFETEVNAFQEGSFAVELSPYEAALEHEALEGAFYDFLALASAGKAPDDAAPSEEIAEVAQSLGTEATRRFALFFAKVHEAQLEARFEWHSDPEKAVALQPEQALQVAAWLKSVEEQFDTLTITGTLTAADVNDARFAVTDELGEIHEGKAAPELLSRAVIDDLYIARMRVTTFTSTITGQVRTRSVLESLDPVDPD